MQPVYILSGARTALGSYMGSLSNVPAPELGAAAIKLAVEKSGMDAKNLTHGWMGQVIQAGVGQAPARQAILKAGLSQNTTAVTVNKVCGSGLEAIISAARCIAMGETEGAIAGGMENMSLAPHLLSNSRTGLSFGNNTLKDAMQWDGLWDVYSNQAMGNCAEECLKEKKLSREQQDEYAAESFKRAQAAQKNKIFDDEIAAVKVLQKKTEISVNQDEGPGKADFEKMLKLKPVFKSDGTITAANASSINDGAAAVILSTQKFSKPGSFKILSWAHYAGHPTWFTTAPVFAIQKALDQAKLKTGQIDQFEINEAFSTVALYAMQDLNIDHKKLNPYGGAIALGHPIGCSGARLMVTLMNGLKKNNGKYGVAALCIGGGEGIAMVVEKV